MEKTEQAAEKAATKAVRQILKGLDQIHRLDPREIVKREQPTAQIIKKHLFDCYTQSWITEAEELEDLFGWELPRDFLLRLAWIKAHGADGDLKRAALSHLLKIPVEKKPLVLRTPKETIRFHSPKHPIDYYVRKHYITYAIQCSDLAGLDSQKKQDFIDWRTGAHGESGLGYRLASLLRTESDTAQATACLDVYREADIPKYRYNAMLDDKTCQKCKDLDGKVFALEDAQPGVNFPTIHMNCRCWIEPVR